MNETVIEAQARYLIEDRIHPTHRQQKPSGVRRRTPEGPPAELAVTLSGSRPEGSRSQIICGRLPAVGPRPCAGSDDLRRR